MLGQITAFSQEVSMGRVDDSLKDFRGRQAIPLFTPQGNYRRSAFKRALCVRDDGAGKYEGYQFRQDATVWMLIFVNGVPALSATSVYPAEQAVRADGLGGGEAIALNGNVEQAIGLITTTEEELWIGQQTTGLTATAQVPIKGYTASMSILARGENFAVGEPFVQVDAISHSGVINAEISHNVAIGLTGYSWDPVILREQDYTQAMRTAGDIVSYTVGPVTFTWQIVGLFWEVPIV